LDIDHPYPFDERPEVVRLIPEVQRLLDIGCSRGGFAAALRRIPGRVGELWGIEPNPGAAEQAREHFDHVITGLYPNDLPSTEPFDAVVFNDVLEHMVDPWATLAFTREILAPRGLVVASIPNVRYWEVLWDLVVHDRWTYTETGSLDKTHLRFFTRSSACELLTTSGYEIERVEPGWQLGRGRRLDWRYLALPAEMRTLQYLIVARLPS
jgi:SAM-dependent methyltransferase